MKKFSADFDLNEIVFYHPKLLILLSALIEYCYEMEIPLHLTSGIRAKHDGISKSKTHQEGRALDIRTKYWNSDQVNHVLKYLKKYDQAFSCGALNVDGESKLFVTYGSVNSPSHLHLQIRR